MTETGQSIRVLDVGCGCGDQSHHLLGLKRTISPETEASATGLDTELVIRHRSGEKSQPLLDSYLGITLEPAQAQFAQQRINEAQNDGDKSTTSTTAEIFCADAADPSSWSGDLAASITDLTTTAADLNTTTWLLALDTMYHFRPSRLPILHYAQNTLHASLMAFDLIIADGVSWRERLLLRIICWITGSPYSNFLSQREYIELLVAAGYDRSRIEMRDISRHVFGGLAEFMGRRVEEARPFGIKLGKYRAARVVFGWWARSGIVRGFVVVARRP